MCEIPNYQCFGGYFNLYDLCIHVISSSTIFAFDIAKNLVQIF